MLHTPCCHWCVRQIHMEAFRLALMLLDVSGWQSWHAPPLVFTTSTPKAYIFYQYTTSRTSGAHIGTICAIHVCLSSLWTRRARRPTSSAYVDNDTYIRWCRNDLRYNRHIATNHFLFPLTDHPFCRHSYHRLDTRCNMDLSSLVYVPAAIFTCIRTEFIHKSASTHDFAGYLSS